MKPLEFFKVDKYSNYFVVSGYNPLSEKILKDFCRQYIQYGLLRVGNRWQKTPLKVFAAYCAPEREYRFHKNQWKEFVRHCSNFGASISKIEVNEHSPKRGTFCSLKDESGKQPRDYQLPILAYLAYIEDTPIRLVGIQTGAGKASASSALIKVPHGWKTMKDIVVGDTITGQNGYPTTVKGKYPQGIRDVYRVTFADGRSTVVDSSHLWEVFYINTSVHKRWRVVDTLEVQRLISFPNPRVYIRLCESEVIEETQSFIIDPYFMGLLLGNGCFTNGSIKYSTIDKETLDYIVSKIPEGMRLHVLNDYDYSIVNPRGKGNYLIDELKRLNLYGKKSIYKFIPVEYLNGTTEQRWSILQGLMDTDGTIGKNGSSSFSSSSEQLALDVQYLARSLGGIAKIYSRIPTYTYKGEKLKGLKTYLVSIRVKTPSLLFRIARKNIRTNDNNQYAADLKLRVSSVQPVGQEETYCINVAAKDSLYVTDDFIVTHNTYVATKAICEEGRRFAVVLKAKYMDKWISDIDELTDCTKHEVLVIRGSAALMAAMEAGKNNKLEHKAIIISNRTLQNYITLYEEKGDKILDMGYDCCPQDLFETLGVDTRLIDEVHEDFHFNFKLDLYTHVHRSISLSATLISEDSFLTNMYELAYPLDERFDELEYDRYIHSHSYHYQIENAERINTIGHGTGMYSHHLLEQNILKNKKLCMDFFGMIRELYEKYFVIPFKSGEKCLIYCASIDMCTALTAWMQEQYPNVDIRRYVENDPYENLMDSRTSISTLQSAGTGHDIKGLSFVLLTVAVSSSKSNVQGFGRLRKIEGKDLHFVYLVCSNMPKHIQYHEQKKQLLLTRSLVHDDIISDKLLGK